MHQFQYLFRDLKIVELATALAGPLTGTFFKELGADVLKIEPPQGDVSLTWKNAFEVLDEKSIYYRAVNGNKKTIRLNLKNQKQYNILRKQILDSDVVITNFTTVKSERFKLTYSHVRAIKPDIILANVTGYGPENDQPAFDMMIQADSGLLSMTGHPGGAPAKVPIAIADILASHQLREGILCALLKKSKTGEGTEIQVSLIDSMIAAMTNQSGNYLMGNYTPLPLGTLHPSIAPYGETFRTKDKKWLLLAVGSESQFQNLCTALNHQEWKEDPAFNTNQNRLKNRALLREKIEAIVIGQPAEYWLAIFGTNDVPAAIIRTLQAVLEDPALQHLIVEEMSDHSLIRRTRTVVF